MTIDKDESLATGIKATHIGPESGGSGAATMGGASSAGVKETEVPADASGFDDAVPAPTGAESEHRSFRPQPAGSAQPNLPLDQEDDDVRGITDGKTRRDHKKH